MYQYVTLRHLTSLKRTSAAVDARNAQPSRNGSTLRERLTLLHLYYDSLPERIGNYPAEITGSIEIDISG